MSNSLTLRVTAAIIGAACLTSVSLACTASPPPFNPSVKRADVVLLGDVMNEVRDNEDAQVAVKRVVAGTYPHRNYTLDHFCFDGSGMCALGPGPSKGDALVIYLLRDGKGRLDLQGFLLLREARKVDRRLQAY